MGGGDNPWLPERVSRRKRKITPPDEFYSTEYPNEYETPDNNER